MWLQCCHMNICQVESIAISSCLIVVVFVALKGGGRISMNLNEGI